MILCGIRSFRSAGGMLTVNGSFFRLRSQKIGDRISAEQQPQISFGALTKI